MSLLVFLGKEFKSHTDACNRCRDVSMTSMSLSDVAILNIHGVDSCYIIKGELNKFFGFEFLLRIRYLVFKITQKSSL